MDPHFLLLNWKRDIFGDILCPSEGQWPPHISSFVAWSRSSSHMCGTQVTCCPCQEHLPLLADERKEVILFLFSFFVIFIHLLAKDVGSRHPFVIEYGYIYLLISSPTLPLEITPIWWSMSTIWWSLSLFETLTIWDHQCRHEGTADQMSPVTAPSRAQNWPISEPKTKPWQLWRCWQWWSALVTVNNFDSCW